MSITGFIQAWLMYPLIMGIATLIVLLLAWFHRARLKVFLQKSKFKWLLPKNKSYKIELFCEDVKHVYVFKPQLVIESTVHLQQAIIQKINLARKTNTIMVMDLTQIELCNENAQEALRVSLRETIEKNNIRLTVVFPKKVLKDLYEHILDYVDEKGCKSVLIKKDTRRKGPR